MVTFMSLVALLFVILGLGSCAISKSAIHEGVGLLCFLNAAVLWGFAATIHGLDKIRERLDGGPNAPEVPDVPNATAAPGKANRANDREGIKGSNLARLILVAVAVIAVVTFVVIRFGPWWFDAAAAWWARRS